jgi:hypothetical protein
MPDRTVTLHNENQVLDFSEKITSYVPENFPSIRYRRQGVNDMAMYEMYMKKRMFLSVMANKIVHEVLEVQVRAKVTIFEQLSRSFEPDIARM